MNYSLYFHIPFCVHRCAYCDFNTYAGQEALIPAYVEALVSEIEAVGRSAPERLPVHTIFFGGGTPSLLSTEQFEKILSAVRDNFELRPVQDQHNRVTTSVLTTEASLEANPGTVSLAFLQGLRQAGFNRMSLGVQSAHPVELRQLERIHDFYDVIESVKWARQAGFDNLNLDLIYGLPEQKLARWQETLRRAVDLGPDHLSLYALTIEAGTPFGRWAASGRLPIPDPDKAADMYEWASEYLQGQGYQQYEISNWAKAGFQCRHNLQYWRNQPYLGFGAGAHGCAANFRIANVLRIRTFMERITTRKDDGNAPFPMSPATATQQPISRKVEMQETMMLGLRLTQEGVSEEAFKERFGTEMRSEFEKEIHELLGLGLIECKRSGRERRIRLTPRGRLLGNQVFIRFVGE